jgi:16S rRNA (guanine966-N2)-methyltransferase
MRVVAGRLKGGALAGPRTDAIRPTSDRLRESLFNILRHAYGLPDTTTRVLDLFAGTGALGIEAISRGASYALFVESSVEGRGLIRTNIEAMALTGITRILRRDASKLGPAGTVHPFDLVLCDPPYEKNFGERALAEAAAGGWLKPGALCVIEERAGVAVALSEDFEVLERRDAGDSQLVFAVWKPESKEDRAG